MPDFVRLRKLAVSIYARCHLRRVMCLFVIGPAWFDRRAAPLPRQAVRDEEETHEHLHRPRVRDGTGTVQRGVRLHRHPGRGPRPVVAAKAGGGRRDSRAHGQWP
ncbi:protein of unknown function [Rhodovastum atsumiense]|nr:protein of unknown function [Rhodovastum atsumiense]